MSNGKTEKRTKIKIDFEKIPKEEVRALSLAALKGAIVK